MLCRMPDRNGTQTHTGLRREAHLVELLRSHGPLSRRRLQDLSGLSRTTVYDAVMKLVTEGTIVIGGAPLARGGRGRPVELLTLNTRQTALRRMPPTTASESSGRPRRPGTEEPDDKGDSES
jgi:predicted ArsR family transcriptional regulator